ncbi:MAG: hypothetical protein HY521_04360 [Proteobacteria bacterium]|nr:hypothetical protein [Pseudomonadota bacterium]
MQSLLASEDRIWETVHPPKQHAAPASLQGAAADGAAQSPSVQLARKTTLRKGSLADFLRETMTEGKAWSLQNLKREAHARGIDFGSKSPGKALHFALVALKNSGYAEMTERGVWKLIDKSDAPSGGAEGAS